MGLDLHSRIGKTLTLECPCDLHSARQAAVRSRIFLCENGVDADVASDLELALAEALNNAVEHAPKDSEFKPMQVVTHIGETEVELRVSDHSSGFQMPDAVALPDADSERGRGLFLMHALTDGVEYLHGTRENWLVLRKRCTRRTPPGGQPDAAQRQRDLEEALQGMTEELSFSYETLASIFRYRGDLATSHDIGKLADQLLEDVCQIAEVDAIVLRIFDPERGELNVSKTHPQGNAPLLRPVSLEKKSESVEGSAAFSRKDTWLESSDALGKDDPLRAIGPFRNAVCHPMALNETLLGTIVVARKCSPEPFKAGQIYFIHTLTDFLAIQIANGRYIADRLRTQVVRRELEIASGIQRSLLPITLPNVSPFTIAASSVSAEEVGGDFYDLLPTEDGGVLVVIVDVMGKGIPAALFAAVLRSIIRSHPQLHSDPAALLDRANQILYADISRVDMFCTAIVAHLDIGRRRISASNAGHCPLLLHGPEPDGCRSIEPSGPPLGVVCDNRYTAESYSLAPGGRALLYTDGITEMVNAGRKMFGEQRLAGWFRDGVGAGAQAAELKDDLLALLAAYRDGCALRDDQSFIMITREVE